MNLEVSGLCEVRVPTFRRPKLLRRALMSLANQTYANWRCIVFDDCPNGTARSIVDNIRDPRILYSRNPTQLGAIGNIDKSFAKQPFFDGRYAFVLEDDNYLLPTHIERAITTLEDNGTKVIFCNQFCEAINAPDEPGLSWNGQTLDWMYDSGVNDPNDLLPALLFSHGFSNGAVFWRTDCLSNFQIGNVTTRPEIQESLRLLRLKDAAYVSLDSTSVWHPTEPKSSLLTHKITLPTLWRAIVNRIQKLRAERERITYQSTALKRLGMDGVLAFISNNQIPDFDRFRSARLLTVERSMLLCGYNVKLTHRGSYRRTGFWLAGFAVRHTMTSLKMDF